MKHDKLPGNHTVGGQRYLSNERNIENFISNVYGTASTSKRRKFQPLSIQQSNTGRLDSTSDAVGLPTINDNLSPAFRST